MARKKEFGRVPRGVSTAQDEAREAAHEALVAELMAKRATADAARALAAAEPLEGRVRDLERDARWLAYGRAETLSRARWCAMGCYGVALGLGVAGAFVSPLEALAAAALGAGAALHLWAAAYRD